MVKWLMVKFRAQMFQETANLCKNSFTYEDGPCAYRIIYFGIMKAGDARLLFLRKILPKIDLL